MNQDLCMTTIEEKNIKITRQLKLYGQQMSECATKSPVRQKMISHSYTQRIWFSLICKYIK